jgi:hypothetical protein
MSRILTIIPLQKLNQNQLKVNNYYFQKRSQRIDDNYICIQLSDSHKAQFFVLFQVVETVFSTHSI